jgi:hypothetical protein
MRAVLVVVAFVSGSAVFYPFTWSSDCTGTCSTQTATFWGLDLPPLEAGLYALLAGTVLALVTYLVGRRRTAPPA